MSKRNGCHVAQQKTKVHAGYPKINAKRGKVGAARDITGHRFSVVRRAIVWERVETCVPNAAAAMARAYA